MGVIYRFEDFMELREWRNSKIDQILSWGRSTFTIRVSSMWIHSTFTSYPISILFTRSPKKFKIRSDLDRKIRMENFLNAKVQKFFPNSKLGGTIGRRIRVESDYLGTITIFIFFWFHLTSTSYPSRIRFIADLMIP